MNRVSPRERPAQATGFWNPEKALLSDGGGVLAEHLLEREFTHQEISMKKRIPLFFKVALAVVAAMSLSSLDVYRSQTRVLDTKQEKAETQPESLVVHVDLVNVLFTVTDRKGKLVT